MWNHSPLFLAIFLLLSLWPAGGGGLAQPAARPSAPLPMAQRKSYDLGNCFQWKTCKGDSIGMLWVHAPEFCATMGGKGWMDEGGRCHSLPEGPIRTEPPRQ
jgi:hypothetical protein